MRRGFRRPLSKIITQQPTKKQSAATEGTTEGRHDEREARGKRNTIVLGGIEFG